MSSPFAFVPRRVPAGWTDSQTDAPWTEPGASTYNHAWPFPYRSFLISYGKARRSKVSFPTCESSLKLSRPLLPCVCGSSPRDLSSFRTKNCQCERG